MDRFNEKIVKKDYDVKDLVIVLCVVSGAFLVVFIATWLLAGYLPMTFLVLVGVGYLVFRLITARSVEYEYIVTNGELDIDRIIAKRKRVRVFSGKATDFEIVARIDGNHYTQEYQRLEKRLEAVKNMKVENIYFIVSRYKGDRMIVFFEPNEQMLQDMRKRNPRNVFI